MFPIIFSLFLWKNVCTHSTFVRRERTEIVSAPQTLTRRAIRDSIKITATKTGTAWLLTEAERMICWGLVHVKRRVFSEQVRRSDGSDLPKGISKKYLTLYNTQFYILSADFPLQYNNISFIYRTMYSYYSMLYRLRGQASAPRSAL